jgi:hypothetical protein
MINTTPKPERVQILNEAAGLIVGQRQEDYGTPEENFQRMADYANIHFKKNLENNIPISARQTAEYMILLKMARTINSPTRDSYVDIGGYAGIAGELAKNEKTEGKLVVDGKLFITNNHVLTENGLEHVANTEALRSRG